jgi:hypothetical protein
MISMCFHVLFHKAETSGFSLDSVSQNGICDHNYPEILNNLSPKNFTSLRDIFFFLDDSGFLPSIDSMKKYAGIVKSNALRELIVDYEKRKCEHINGNGEAVMLILREKLLEHEDIVSIVQNLISTSKFEILFSEVELRQEFKDFARGGNWQRGPFPVSGGEPYKALVLFNKTPEFIINEDGFQQDKNIIELKAVIRSASNECLSPTKHFNALHTTDCLSETLEYAEYLGPHAISKLSALVSAAQDQAQVYKSFDVAEDLTAFGRRAEVYKIRYNDSPAVLKVFNNSAREFFDNEVFFYRLANAHGLAVPKLIDVGDLYFISEFIDGERMPAKISGVLWLGPQIFEPYDCFVRQCHSLGVFNADFVFANSIIQSDGKVIFYDFEFVQKYREVTTIPYEFSGVPFATFHNYLLPLGYERNSRVLKFYRSLMRVLSFCGYGLLRRSRGGLG